ncbi:hypothetical protein ACJJTC_018952 [Scirpophaga incertulas]
MSFSNNENEEPSSSCAPMQEEAEGNGGDSASSETRRPPAKRRLSNTVIEISDTESDDSDVCAVNSYQASADEVKRIRGEDYSSTSTSSSDYSSDSDSPWEDDSIIVTDSKYNSKSKPVRAHLNTRANRMDDPKFNPILKSHETIDRLKSHWGDTKDLTTNEVILTCDPFNVCQLQDFLENPEIINNIVDDMNTLDWTRKKMDLYEFHQTTDLANLTWQRSIRGIYELLKTEVMALVTGLQLSSLSASCSLYGPGDHLLVHDDLHQDRRVAFILYLAPWSPRQPAVNGGHADHMDEGDHGGWSSEMGGRLELLQRGDDGPTEVVRRLLPRNNMLAFFCVSPHSYHQVEEVESLELPRLSINGWFHGPATGDEPATPPPPSLPLAAPPHTHIVLLNQWVESTYMSPRSRVQIQAQVEADSEICMRDFLQPLQYQRLLDALQDVDVEWEWVGPAHQRRYERVSDKWLQLDSPSPQAGEEAVKEHPVRAVTQLLSSAAFFHMLRECTDLTLTSYERLELQRWSPGCFTLLPPREHYQTARLEVVYCLGGSRSGFGGHTAVVAPEDPNGGSLLTVPAVPNALTLVYCDKGAAAFAKYRSRIASRGAPVLYRLVATYRE